MVRLEKLIFAGGTLCGSPAKIIPTPKISLSLSYLLLQPSPPATTHFPLNSLSLSLTGPSLSSYPLPPSLPPNPTEGGEQRRRCRRGGGGVDDDVGTDGAMVAAAPPSPSPVLDLAGGGGATAPARTGRRRLTLSPSPLLDLARDKFEESF